VQDEKLTKPFRSPEDVPVHPPFQRSSYGKMPDQGNRIHKACQHGVVREFRKGPRLCGKQRLRMGLWKNVKKFFF